MRAPGLPLLQPARVTLVKSLNPLKRSQSSFPGENFPFLEMAILVQMGAEMLHNRSQDVVCGLCSSSSLQVGLVLSSGSLYTMVPTGGAEQQL